MPSSASLTRLCWKEYPKEEAWQKPMKPKPLVVSAVAVISLIACVGFHAATRSPDELDRTLPDPPMAGAGRARSAATEPITERQRVGASHAPRSSRRRDQTENSLGIPTIDLLAAREIADGMAADLEQNLTTMQGAGYAQQSRTIDNPSQKLGLRLGVDAGVAEKLGGILAADRAGEIERRIAAEKARLERTQQWLESDRDNYVNYLALESMLSRGVPLSEEQQAFHQQFRQNPDSDMEPESDAANQEWYEKPDVLDAMHRHLSAEEQAELAKFVDEQITREQERQTTHAYMRSSTIADRLGLDEGERTTLYEYLRENPDASSSELSGILAPELRELLPPGL